MSGSSRKFSLPWQNSLQVRLVIISVLFAIVPAISIGVLAFTQARNALFDSFGTTIQELTAQIGQDTQQFNQVGHDSIQLIAAFPILNSDVPGDVATPAQKRKFLQSIQQVYPFYDDLYVLDLAGNIVANSGDVIAHQSDQSWFQQAVGGETVVSDVYKLATTDESIITFATPLMSPSGSLIGVVAGNANSQQINDLLAANLLGKTGDVFMVDRQGMIVADPVPEEVFSDVAYLEPIQAALRGETGTMIAIDPHTGETSLFAYTPAVGVQDWISIGQVPIEELTDPITELVTRTRIVVFIAFLFVIAIIILITRNIVRPLKKLTLAAQQLGEGHYTTNVAVESSDEIGQLAKAFNSMTNGIVQRDQQVQGLVVTLEHRVQETQEAREQAERSDKVKSAFLASMSHELRTPLNAVINFTKFVATGVMGPVNDEQKETLNESIDSAKHLLNLINDVLDMSKIESGSLSLFVEDNINLNTILNSVMNTGKSLLGDKPVQLELDAPPSLPLIRGDRQRILQILLNIVSNACKFTEKGSITLKVRQTGEDVLISVKDTGPGIAAEDQAAVFEPFKQTISGLRQGSGTGLGMPISRSLTEIHGGRLWLESKNGEGSTFNVSLPVRSETLKPIQELMGAVQ